MKCAPKVRHFCRAYQGGDRMIEIGTFKEIENDDYPPFESTDQPIPEKEIVLRYLKETPDVAAAPAILRDVFTGESLHMELLARSDGVYIWRSDIAYYFEKYDLKLPNEFIEYVLQQTAAK